jgi:sensor c-di-GMP phosphodiesterase-like protein
MADGGDLDLNAIEVAFERREFFLKYQPIVSLQDGRCLGAEALIRWKRPDGSTMDAGAFMPAVDRTPLSGIITYWVIDTVAVELNEWLDANPEANIAINIPPEILGRGGLDYAAKKSGLRARAGQLILEITERGVPDQQGLDALNRVPETGARVALDDTMLSGANLALLMRCRFDFVKVDQSLVQQIDGDVGQRRPSWLDGLAALLASTSLQIVAEGVETPSQAEVLKNAGVQWGQGHLLAEPLALDEFVRYYAQTPGSRQAGEPIV